VKWANCTGIAKVQTRVIDKKTGKQLAGPDFATTDPSASKLNWEIFLPDSAAGDVVQVTSYALNSGGAQIAKTLTVEVTLK
jgi:hypothetical protein